MYTIIKINLHLLILSPLYYNLIVGVNAQKPC